MLPPPLSLGPRDVTTSFCSGLFEHTSSLESIRGETTSFSGKISLALNCLIRFFAVFVVIFQLFRGICLWFANQLITCSTEFDNCVYPISVIGASMEENPPIRDQLLWNSWRRMPSRRLCLSD